MTAVRASEHEELLDYLGDSADGAAEAAGGYSDSYVALAGMTVRMRFAGDAMRAPMTMALAHLAAEPVADPDLTVRIWDSESTGTVPPRPPWDLDAYRERGVIRGYFEDGLYTLFEWGTRALNVLDTRNGEALFWIRSAGGLGMPEWGAPLRSMLNLWLQDRGAQMVHAAGVGRPDGSVLLVGASGVGKSTSALSCLRSPLLHLGEDYCIATFGDRPEIWSLYCTAKVTPETLARLPELSEMIVRVDGPGFDEKDLVDLNLGAPDRLLERSPLAAVAVPRIVGGDGTAAVPCTSGEALSALAPSTLLQLPGTGEETLRRISEVIRSVPCFRLELGDDPDKVPVAIESMLEPA